MMKQLSNLGWLLAIIPLFLINLAHASLRETEHPSIVLDPGTSFHGIENHGSCDVLVSIGETERITITGDPEETKLVETKVENGVLKFSIKNINRKGLSIRVNAKPITINVVATRISVLKQIGSGSIKVDDPLLGQSLALEVKGSGDIIAKSINVDNLAAAVIGSGDILLEGTAKNGDIQVNGSGDFRGRNLSIDNASVRVVGSGDAYVEVNNTLSATVTGSGDIRYSGTVKNVTTNKTGSGSITKN